MSTNTEEASPKVDQLTPPAQERATSPPWVWVYLLRIGHSRWRIAIAALLILAAFFVWRVTGTQARSGLQGKHISGLEATTPESVLRVPVDLVTRADVYTELPIVAEFRPYEQVDLHAKVSGYVQEILVDFGDRVKAGQLLARLEVPELQSELDRALAARKKAEADHRYAHVVYTALAKVEQEHPNLVAQQDLDAAEAKDAMSEAVITGAKADVEKYQTLVSYTRITAPFDGIVTRRFADPGTLIQSGTASDTQSLPLVRISNNYRLRLDIPVSVANVKDIRLGDPVEVQIESLGAANFTGIIKRFTSKVDEDTRTMITEVEVPNPELRLIPGMYAKVVLKVDRRPSALTIPTGAVAADQSDRVFVVNKSHQIEQRQVTLGLETPFQWEVKSGLDEGDLVLTAKQAQVQVGQKVEPVLIRLNQ